MFVSRRLRAEPRSSTWEEGVRVLVRQKGLATHNQLRQASLHRDEYCTVYV